MSDFLKPKIRAENLEHAPKVRGQYVQVPEYMRYGGLTNSRRIGRGEHMEIERGPQVRKLEIE